MAGDEGPYTAAIGNIKGRCHWERQVLMRELY
jgi:hypothetical protein